MNAALPFYEQPGIYLILAAFLLAAHIGGAIFHHAIRRDGTLLRMI